MGFESGVSSHSNIPRARARERGFIDLLEFGVCGSWLLKCKPSDLGLDLCRGLDRSQYLLL